MSDKNHDNILGKARQANLADAPVSRFMSTDYITLEQNYSIKGTIEIFRIHRISGAPVVDFQKKIVGVISEYDLLIQAASKPLAYQIEYQSQVMAVNPDTTLKDVLVILYKNKLKWMPVITKEGYVQGVVARIDVLNFIATNSEQSFTS